MKTDGVSSANPIEPASLCVCVCLLSEWLFFTFFVSLFFLSCVSLGFRKPQLRIRAHFHWRATVIALFTIFPFSTLRPPAPLSLSLSTPTFALHILLCG